MEKIEKSFLVIQGNAFIEKKRNLSLEEQKIILIFASLIKKEDENFKTYEVQASKIMDLLDVKTKTKYIALKETLKNLSKKPIEYDDGKSFEIIQWFSDAEYRNGVLKIKFSEKLKPYLLQLKEFFTKYKLENVLYMKSKYSLQLYEWLKANEFKKSIYITVDELRDYFVLDYKYKQYGDFKKRTILKAQEEINEKTDIRFEFEEIKKGRIVKKIKFIIHPKKVFPEESIEEINRIEEIKKEIDPVIQANIQTLKNIFNIAEVEEKDILSILNAADNDMAKIIEKYYIIKNNKDISNFTGLMIEAIRNDYAEIAVAIEEVSPKNNIKTKFHNFEQRTSKYSAKELEKMVLDKQRKK